MKLKKTTHKYTKKYINMRYYIIFLLLIFSVSCKTKKITTIIEKTDTIKTTKLIKIKPSSISTLVVDSPCDELGNLKPFKYSFGTGKNKTTLEAKNDTIYLTQNLDSIKSVWEKEYKSKNLSKEKVTIIYKKPLWIWYSLLFNIIFVLLYLKTKLNIF